MRDNDILNKVFLQRSLVSKLTSDGLNSLTREELSSLHELDEAVRPYDIIGIFFDELSKQQAVIEKLKEQRDKALRHTPLIHHPEKLDAMIANYDAELEQITTPKQGEG